MPPIERILCPTDFSESSAKAYDYAYSLARHYGAKLFVQHVAEQVIAPYHGYIAQNQIEELNAYESAEAQKNFHELAKKAKNGLKQEFVFQRWGPAADFILSFTEEQRIDLIVMGTHGRRGLDRLIVGSVLERVLRKARSPVLAVRGPHPDVPRSKEHDIDIRKILFCTDFSEDSPRALEYALSLAMQYRAELSLLHVVESVRNEEEFEQQKENARASLQAGVPSGATDWATVVLGVRAGKAYQEIVQYAEEAESDLIVMGVRGRNAVDLALFGSSTQRVVQLGPCPVLVVRT